MPTYEYTCKRCGENIEVFQSFSEKPLRKHQECGGELQKVFHARGVVFKGSGFYSTDSRSSTSAKKSDPAKKADSTKSDSAKKSESAATGSSTASSGSSSTSE
ncbi:MAG TPA: FmdB family zinc ribbon protein [Acidimicrobiia bacterium]|jgi:putative FmdB family regulatory protein|nr:FmdB family zinc ribbon protein [Acidimicrobiia bacterium]